MHTRADRPDGRPGTVLVVEDDGDVRALVCEVLERAGYAAVAAAGGREALRAFYARRPDLVVLDLVIPDVDGWSTLERIRDVSDVPVLMLTARTSEVEKVRALRAGADDYVTKPFGRHELLARVEALLRRAGEQPPAERDRYADSVLAIDLAARRVTVEGQELQLTPLEYRVLAALVRHAGATLTHAELLELVWGTARGGTPEQVRLAVNYLRRKVGPRASAAIETVRGFGYRYRPPDPV